MVGDHRTTAKRIEAIERAVELGMNWIDTAAVYGLGHSEELVGQAIRGMRRKPYIFTKCALRWDDRRNIHNSMKADSLRYECDASLRRLDVDVIDLYQIHWPDPDREIEEGWETLARLQEEGAGALDRRFQLQRCTDAARAAHRTDHFAAAAVLAAGPRCRERHPALLRPKTTLA